MFTALPLSDAPRLLPFPLFASCATSVFEQQGAVDEKDARIAEALSSASFDSSHNPQQDADIAWADFKAAQG